LLSGSIGSLAELRVVVPQVVLSIVAFPILARLVAQFDRLRLMRVRRIG
jgi:rod shape-determining protein MreD